MVSARSRRDLPGSIRVVSLAVVALMAFPISLVATPSASAGPLPAPLASGVGRTVLAPRAPSSVGAGCGSVGSECGGLSGARVPSADAVSPSSSGALYPNATTWPTLLGGVERTSANPADPVISPQTVSALEARWNLTADAPIFSSMAYAGGQLYFGTQDGLEYDVNAATGQVVWTTTLAGGSECAPGVYSTPTVWNGTVFVAGAGNYWYALNAANGSVEWSIEVAAPGLGTYNYFWASPLIFDGFLYIGVSSCLGNTVQGRLLQVNLTGNHTVFHTFDTTPAGTNGSTITTTPAGDPLEHLVWITTGNGNSNYSRSVVALNATTLALVGSWQNPDTAGGLGDFESATNFASAPVLVNDSAGRPLALVMDRQGVIYALDRSNVTANGSWAPVWSADESGGSYPDYGYSTPMAFDGSRLYVANFSNGLLALDPTNGSVVWSDATGLSCGGLPTPVEVAGGVLIDWQTPYLQFRNASTGALLRALNVTTGSNCEGNPGPIVVAGQVFVTVGPTVFDLGVPLTATFHHLVGFPEAPAVLDGSVDFSGGAPPVTVSWQIGNMATVSGTSIAYTLTRAGNFSVNVTVRDSYGSVVAQSFPVQVYPALVATILHQTPVLVSETLPLNLVFLSSVSGGAGPPYAITWGLSPGFTNQTAPDVAYTVRTPGNYTLTLEVHDEIGGAARAASELIEVRDPLSVRLSPSQTLGESPLAVNVTALVTGGFGGYSFTWAPGDGGIWQHTPGLTHVYTVPGSYSVDLTVVDAQGFTVFASTSIEVLMGPSMALAAVVPPGPCAPSPELVSVATTVLNGAAPYAFNWSLDGGPFARGSATQEFPITSSGSHTVVAQVSDALGGTYTASTQFTLPPLCAAKGTTPVGPGPVSPWWDQSLFGWGVFGVAVGAAVAAALLLGRSGRAGATRNDPGRRALRRPPAARRK